MAYAVESFYNNIIFSKILTIATPNLICGDRVYELKILSLFHTYHYDRIGNTLECCYNRVQYNNILYTALYRLKQNLIGGWSHRRHPIPRHEGELWDVFCEDLEENWLRFNSTGLYCVIINHVYEGVDCTSHSWATGSWMYISIILEEIDILEWDCIFLSMITWPSDPLPWSHCLWITWLLWSLSSLYISLHYGTVSPNYHYVLEVNKKI